jgi:hypothetical protein
MTEATQLSTEVQKPKTEAIKPLPSFQEFFFNHPVGWNKKQVKLDFKDNDGNDVQMVLTFTWQGMQCTYVHASTCFDRKDCFVGSIDLFNTSIWETPNSLTRTAPLSIIARQFVRSFRSGRHSEFFKVTML